ncbi:MAG: DsbA family protein [Myxococcota bacterium]
MGDRNGAALVIAALILGAAVVASGLLIQTSIDNAAAELAGVRTALASAQTNTRTAAAPAAPRQQRPDPSKRYSVNTAGSPSKGPGSAKVTLVEFSDFQCPYCSRVTPTIKQIEKEYGDKVRIVFKHLPLRIHSRAAAAHAASEAAHRQGKFWEMHDLIFANQREMAPEKYVEYAEKIGLDMDRFERDVAAAEIKEKVDADAAEAQTLGVTGTPGFFINGRFLRGARPFQSFKEVIDEELAAG